MRIDRLSAQPDRAGRYKVEFSDGTVMRLYRHTVQDFGLYTAMELTDEEMKNLQEAASKMSAKMRAVRIVSASNVSKQDLQQRLIQKGEDAQSAKQAVAWMEEMHLIDDSKTAEQIVFRCIGKGYGLARAKQMLYEKRIPKELWQEVLADYPDQSDAVYAYIQNHLSDRSDPKAVKKVIDALIRQGHSYGIIRRMLNMEDVLED